MTLKILDFPARLASEVIYLEAGQALSPPLVTSHVFCVKIVVRCVAHDKQNTLYYLADVVTRTAGRMSDNTGCFTQ
jgi:hypothetical protein